MSTSQKVERSNFQSCIIITEMHSHKDLLLMTFYCTESCIFHDLLFEETMLHLVDKTMFYLYFNKRDNLKYISIAKESNW